MPGTSTPSRTSIVVRVLIALGVLIVVGFVTMWVAVDKAFDNLAAQSAAKIDAVNGKDGAPEFKDPFNMLSPITELFGGFGNLLTNLTFWLIVVIICLVGYLIKTRRRTTSS